MGGGGIIVCLSALVFPYIFVLVHYFEECIAVYHVQLLVQSDIWGGWGGLIVSFTQLYLKIESSLSCLAH